MDAIEKAKSDLLAMGEILMEDVAFCLHLLSVGDCPSLRRQLCRSIFADIEGTLFGLKEFARVANEFRPVEFTPEEKQCLTGAKSNGKYFSFTKNYFLTLSAVAKAMKNGFKIDNGGDGWSNLSAGVKIRNRITHPRSSTDLEITTDEVVIIQNAQTWFFTCRDGALTVTTGDDP